MNIGEIPKEGKKLNIKKDNTWFMSMVGDSDIDVESLYGDLISKIDIHMQYTKSVVINGSVQADVVVRCVKCLQLFHQVIDNNFSVVLEPYEASAPTKHAIVKTELEAEFYVNDEFDPEAVVFEQIMLSLPMYPLCKPDCKGLCPYCGINLNENPEHKCYKNMKNNSLRNQLEKIKNITKE